MHQITTIKEEDDNFGEDGNQHDSSTYFDNARAQQQQDGQPYHDEYYEEPGANN